MVGYAPRRIVPGPQSRQPCCIGTELGEVVTEHGERLELRPGVYLLLEFLPPGLQPGQVLAVRGFAGDEFVFVFLLWYESG